MGDCGAIYQIRVPDVNAGLGARVWHTIDLEYQATQMGAKGFMTELGNDVRNSHVIELERVSVDGEPKIGLRRMGNAG